MSNLKGPLLNSHKVFPYCTHMAAEITPHIKAYKSEPIFLAPSEHKQIYTDVQ